MRKLYIIVRTDMDSMTPGRIAAQTSHAANQFVFDLPEKSFGDNLTHKDKRIMDAYNDWVGQTTKGFGTAIILNGGSEENICNLLDSLNTNKYFNDFVIDPEYHIKDGETVHIVENVLTCAYVFTIDDLPEYEELKEFSLL